MDQENDHWWMMTVRSQMIYEQQQQHQLSLVPQGGVVYKYQTIPNCPILNS